MRNSTYLLWSQGAYEPNELAGPGSRENMPPSMKLQSPSQRQAQHLPNVAEQHALFEIDLPQSVAQCEDAGSLGKPDKKLPSLGLGPVARVDEIHGARSNQAHHRVERVHVVQDVRSVDVDGRQDGDGDEDNYVDQSRAAGRLVDSVDALEESTAEEKHADLVAELRRVAQGGVEDERVDAENEKGHGHPVELATLSRFLVWITQSIVHCNGR